MRASPLTISNNKSVGKLPRGSEEHFLDKGLESLVTRWNDNGVVTITSNEHGMVPTKRVDRYSAAAKKKISVCMSKVIHMYRQEYGRGRTR